MFSQTVEYALRAVVHLAHAAPELQTTDQVSLATQVPAPYLSKILQGLGREGIVKSQRGIGGGHSLLSEPEELTILDVVNAVDPVRRIQECPLGIKTHGKRLCPLHSRLDKLLAQVETACAETTLADILNERTRSKPLCESADRK